MNSIKLIEEIRKRPSLYESNIKSYYDGNLRAGLWGEIGEAVFENWTTITSDAKEKAVSKMKKKWHTLRSGFCRAIKHNRTLLAEGDGERPKRSCAHYKELSFLLPIYENASQDGSDTRRTSAEIPSRYPSQPTSSVSSSSSSSPPLTERRTDELDGDRNFALSLVPMLRKLPEKEKLIVKMRILNAFRPKKPHPYQSSAGSPSISRNPSLASLPSTSQRSRSSFRSSPTQVDSSSSMNSPLCYLSSMLRDVAN